MDFSYSNVAVWNSCLFDPIGTYTDDERLRSEQGLFLFAIDTSALMRRKHLWRF